MTLSDLQDHSATKSHFGCDFSYSHLATDHICAAASHNIL